MSYPTKPFKKSAINIQPQARYCMQLLQISNEDVVTTINEWERGEIIATDPQTEMTFVEDPKTADQIPALHVSERTFPERNLIIVVYYSTSMRQRRGKIPVKAGVHWVCIQEPFNFKEVVEPLGWLVPKKYKN